MSTADLKNKREFKGREDENQERRKLNVSQKQ